MKCGSRMALGVAGGYLLGRSRKMKLAVFLAIVAAGGRLPADPNELLRRVPLLGEGGPLDELAGDLRGRLVEAGKTAAMTAASSRIDSLSDRLERRTATMRAARPPREEADDYEAGERATRARPRGRGRPAPREEPEDYREDYEDYEYEEPEQGRDPRTRSREGTERR